MASSEKPLQASEEVVPAVLLLSEAVEPVAVTGEFDVGRQTWSNRNFECAAAKKHNEAM